jgi:hypothetical protein
MNTNVLKDKMQKCIVFCIPESMYFAYLNVSLKVFLDFFFICRPSDSTVSEDAGIEPRTVATLTLTLQTL